MKKYLSFRKKKTLIIITHKKELLKVCDKIYELENGIFKLNENKNFIRIIPKLDIKNFMLIKEN